MEDYWILVLAAIVVVVLILFGVLLIALGF